ncbi:hypothetical protein F5Y06DRAFT_299757 [Hypoxylon sp. FL0890]|nr:hypothetical protein F5Y06DRAFT_299757 [Hypoxylon sp. FL0890]
MVDLKSEFDPPVPIPQEDDNRDPSDSLIPSINIYHPGYSKEYSPLLRFLALDDGGIDYDLVYYACHVITGNVYLEEEQTTSDTVRNEEASSPKSYLAESSDVLTATPLIRPPDGILRKKTYYFHVRTDSEDPYPIIPTFSHWMFPHGKLPRPWRSLRIYPIPYSKIRVLPKASSDATHTRDESCRISRSFCALEQAHIIPKAADPWFIGNNMSQYSSNPSAIPEIDELSNTLLLRLDIHRMLDKKELTLFPKLQDGEYKMVTHILRTQLQYFFEQESLYHNRKCQKFFGVMREFLFARFAWSLFHSSILRIFESKAGPIKVRVREPGGLGDTPVITTMAVRSVSQLPIPFSDEKEDQGSEAGSTSKKRSRSGRNTRCFRYFDVAKEQMVYSFDDTDESGSEDITDDEELHRGRKIRRRDSFNNNSTPSLSPSSASSVDSSDQSKDHTVAESGEEVACNVATQQVVPFKDED